jgi:hypothetical protein
VFERNFKRTYVRPDNSWNLRSCKQKPGESLHLDARNTSMVRISPTATCTNGKSTLRLLKPSDERTALGTSVQEEEETRRRKEDGNGKSPR